MQALHDLIKLGKVRYIGASSMWAYQFAMLQFCAEKNGWTKFVSMQNQYNLLYREEEREMIKFCNETGVGLIPVSRHINLQSSTCIDIFCSGHLYAAVTSLVQLLLLVPHLARRKSPKTLSSTLVGWNKIRRLLLVLRSWLKSVVGR